MNHVNERPLSYWVELFEQRDFVPISCIRPIFRNCKTRNEVYNRYGVTYTYYANNSVLYIKKDKLNNYKINPKDYEDNFNLLPFHWQNIITSGLSKGYIMIPRNKITNAASKIYNKLFHRK